MPTLFNAPSVDPAAVTPADIAAILADDNVHTDRPVPADFFQPNITYRRLDAFQCRAVGWFDAEPIALGLLPVNLDGRRTWEFGYLNRWDWQRGWTAASPDATDTTPNEETSS